MKNRNLKLLDIKKVILNWAGARLALQNLPRMSWTLRKNNDLSGRFRIKYGMTLFKRHAFTLIELLVVVLIIGILAAIAVPQYQAAVLKSRFTAMLPLMRSLKNAQERYYMENGEYAVVLADLDIQLPESCEPSRHGKNMWFCGDEWYIDNGVANGKPYGLLTVRFCPGNTERSYLTCGGESVAALEFYYDQKTSATFNASLVGKTICRGNTPLGEKMCKNFFPN